MRDLVSKVKSQVLSAMTAVAAVMALSAPLPTVADVELVWFANYTDANSALSSGQIDANSQTWSDTMGPLAKALHNRLSASGPRSAARSAGL